MFIQVYSLKILCSSLTRDGDENFKLRENIKFLKNHLYFEPNMDHDK